MHPQGVNRANASDTRMQGLKLQKELYKFGNAMNNPKQLRATRWTERLN
jgi:hypothetical protein